MKRLNAELLGRLERLSILAKKVQIGAAKGERRSKRKGTSIEFADYRNYVQGDDLRHVDWNIFSRLGSLYLKLFMGLDADEQRVAEGRRRIERFAPVLEAQLDGRAFVTGDAVTLADFSLAAPLSHRARAGLPFDSFPNILAWNDRLEEIAAWRDSGSRLRERMAKAEVAAGLRFYP